MKRVTVGVAVAALVVAAAAGTGVGVLLDRRAAEPEPTATTEPETTSADDDLVARLPADVYSSCAPDTDREDAAAAQEGGAGRVTSLTCLTPGAGVDELLVTQWSDAATMTADFEATYGAKPDGKCGEYAGDPPTGLRTTWGQGFPMSCYLNSNGAAVLLWEYPDQALQVLAVRRDGGAPAVFAWWLQQSAGPQPTAAS